MLRGMVVLMWAFAPVVSAEEDELFFNQQKAPESIEDLQAIQDALLKVLPETRKAVVGIEMGMGSGSGVIVSEDGLVLTAAHVSGGIDIDMTVILEDGTRLDAVSLGVDGTTDAAMIKIVPEGKYPFATVDRTDSAQLGHWVFAMGHPGGYDEERGSIVRLGRLVRNAATTIQSDCKLIGGDSGGPIFDMKGRVIGINSRVGQTFEQSMHVPSRVFVEHWDAMLGNEWIGDEMFAQKPVKGQALIGVGLKELEDDGGLEVLRVNEDSGADKAGVEEGDILIKADDQDIPNRAALDEIMAEKAPQDRIKLLLKRGEEEVELTVKLGTRPQ